MRLSLKHRILSPLVALALFGCAETSTTRLAQDTMRIDVSAPPACSSASARQLASKIAAVETLRAGYDKYLVAGTQSQDNVRVVGANVAPNYGTGGAMITPMMGGAREAAMIVVMFNDSDPDGANAIDARSILGSDWEKLVIDGVSNYC